MQKTFSPIDGRLYAERPYASEKTIENTLARAVDAQRHWKQTPLAQRRQILEAFVAWMEQHAEPIGEEIALQMGRPIRYAPFEIRRGFAERSRYMLSIAEQALADITIDPGRRFIRREPVGVVFTIAPWNYPYLTSVNSIVPALAAGNAVVLKHSAQTPLCAERYAEGLKAAGLPDGVFSHLTLTHQQVDQVIADPRIVFVAFTGSVSGGHAVQKAAAGRFIGTALELGGKDPAYVRADADLPHAIENLVDGAMFNSGQSCCGIERVYVHRSVYQPFVEGCVDLARQYILGHPLDAATTLGPMVRASAADFVRAQVKEAVAQGAKAWIEERGEGAYLGPQILTNVTPQMRVLSEETFGPVLPIVPVDSDDEALAAMNASDYGLTAALWTRDAAVAEQLGNALETGTVFMNRCDYLDPALAWTGVKDSGRGCALSILGYEQLTRPKSFHFVRQ